MITLWLLWYYIQTIKRIRVIDREYQQTVVSGQTVVAYPKFLFQIPKDERTVMAYLLASLFHQEDWIPLTLL